MEDSKLGYPTLEFEEALDFDDRTRNQFNEKERYYADQLIAQGFTVGFNDKRFLHRKEGQVISYLRTNLK